MPTPAEQLASLESLNETYELATAAPWTAVQSGGVWKGVPTIDEPHHTRGTPGEGELFSIYTDSTPYIDRFCRRLGGEELEAACKAQAKSGELSIARLHNAFPELYALAKFGLLAKQFLIEHGVTVAHMLQDKDYTASDAPDGETIKAMFRAYEALLERATELT